MYIFKHRLWAFIILLAISTPLMSADYIKTLFPLCFKKKKAKTSIVIERANAPQHQHTCVLFFHIFVMGDDIALMDEIIGSLIKEKYLKGGSIFEFQAPEFGSNRVLLHIEKYNGFDASRVKFSLPKSDGVFLALNGAQPNVLESLQNWHREINFMGIKDFVLGASRCDFVYNKYFMTLLLFGSKNKHCVFNLLTKDLRMLIAHWYVALYRQQYNLEDYAFNKELELHKIAPSENIGINEAFLGLCRKIIESHR